jgi:hypothetical protein
MGVVDIPLLVVKSRNAHYRRFGVRSAEDVQAYGKTPHVARKLISRFLENKYEKRRRGESEDP